MRDVRLAFKLAMIEADVVARLVVRFIPVLVVAAGDCRFPFLVKSAAGAKLNLRIST